jgi:hypothetical protein
MMVYVNHIITANPTFHKVKDSSLDPLNNLLQNAPPGGINANAPLRRQILETLGVIPYAKQQKYAAALNYAVQQLHLNVPGIPYGYPIVSRHRLVEYEVSEARWNNYQDSRPDGWFHHVMQLEWRSSNGNMQSLAAIWNQERITYLQYPIGPPHRTAIMSNTPQTYIWPPHPNQNSNAGFGQDDHFFMHPSLMVDYPLAAGVLNAEQQYLYSPDQGQTWYEMRGGQFRIDRGIRAPLGGGQNLLVFFFSKRNNPMHNTSIPFHFEVEYIIGGAPQNPPQTYNEVRGAQLGQPAQLANYARIIAGG